MKLVNRDGQVVIDEVTLDNIKYELLQEYVGHIDNNILDNKIHDINAIISISDILQSINHAKSLMELVGYVKDIGWKFKITK